MTQSQPVNRRDPPDVGSEREQLSAFLDYQRETLLWKVDGLSKAELLRPLMSSGMMLLGLVKHLAYVERWWFQSVFAGEDVDYPWTDDDPDADWRVEPDEDVASVLDFYRAEATRSREIMSTATHAAAGRRPELTMDRAAHDRGNGAPQRACGSDARGYRWRHGGIERLSTISRELNREVGDFTTGCSGARPAGSRSGEWGVAGRIRACALQQRRLHGKSGVVTPFLRAA